MVKKYYDLLCIVCAGFFLAGVVVYFFVDYLPMCHWKAEKLGPALICSPEILQWALVYCSPRAWLIIIAVPVIFIININDPHEVLKNFLIWIPLVLFYWSFLRGFYLLSKPFLNLKRKGT